MEVETVEKKFTPGQPIEINTKLVTLEHLIHCLRKLLGTEKFMIEMRHDVYKIKSEKSIDAQDLIAQCRPSGMKPEIEDSTLTPNKDVDECGAPACRKQQTGDVDESEF
ncbi:hypothetical protein F5Y09DRAFT_357851 [Xylaria sp. FL1042]|nr:hypothetical protein F5Y09DRAFT_357851 [Xylaria sp. FL1042]